MNKQLKKQMLVAIANSLVKLTDKTCGDVPPRESKTLYAVGICSHVEPALRNWAFDLPNEHEPWALREEGRGWLTKTMRKWPEFSGSLDYPVPAPDDMYVDAGLYSDWVRWHGTRYVRVCRAKHAFYNLPRWQYDEYGQARRRLLAFLLERVAEEL